MNIEVKKVIESMTIEELEELIKEKQNEIVDDISVTDNKYSFDSKDIDSKYTNIVIRNDGSMWIKGYYKGVTYTKYIKINSDNNRYAKCYMLDKDEWYICTIREDGTLWILGKPKFKINKMDKFDKFTIISIDKNWLFVECYGDYFIATKSNGERHFVGKAKIESDSLKEIKYCDIK